jgi:hypothetical protein
LDELPRQRAGPVVKLRESQLGFLHSTVRQEDESAITRLRDRAMFEQCN